MGRGFPYRLAAMDLDDTLLGNDKRISAANAAAVQRLADLGLEVVLASGRGFRNMLPFQEQLGLEGFVVAVSGGLVKHSVTGEVLRKDHLPAQELPWIVEEGIRRKVAVLCYREEAVYAAGDFEWMDYYRKASGHDVRPFEGAVKQMPIDKVLWLSSPDRIAELAPEAASRCDGRVCAMTTDRHYLEFTPTSSNKALGLAAVAQYHGVAASDVIAFGDGNNDVPMLSWAGMSVAMHFGSESARSAAKRVSPEGDCDSALARATAALLAEYGVR